MKTKLTLLFILLAAATVAGNAQYFVEGSVGMRYDGNKSDGGLTPGENSNFSIGFSPQMGYWLNNNMAVGVRVILSQHDIKSTNSSINYERNEKNSIWRLAAFSRYKLWGTEKLSLLLDGSIYYESGSNESTITEGMSVIETSDFYHQIGINVFPAATYYLTEKFSFITKFNFLNMELYSQNMKRERTIDGIGDSNKVRTNSFVFSGSTLLTSLGNINIGFIYNF